MLKLRIVTAIVLIALLLPVLFSGEDRLWQGMIGLIVLLAGWEWGRLAGLRPIWLQWSYGGLTAVLTLWSLNGGFGLPAEIWTPVIWLVVAPLVLYTFIFLRGQRLRSPLALLALGVMVLLLFAWTLFHGLIEYGPWMVLWWMALVWLADTGAYFAGRRWGRHRLAPAISPGKTWEGVAGGALLALTGGVLGSVWLDASLSPVQGLLMGVVAAASVEGDLLESALKRWAGMKDSSHLLPGHGGVLDRIDSLLFAVPWMWLIMAWGGSA